jgi:hypothetical protein
LTWNIFILFFCIFCIFIAFFAFFAFLSHFIAFLSHFPHFYRIFHIFIAFFVFLSHFSNFSHFYFKTLKSINLRFFTPFFCNAPKFTPFFVPHRGKFTPGQSRFYDGKFTAVNSKKRSKSVNWSKSLMLTFQPCLMFVDKAWTYPIEEPFRCFTLG